MRCDALNRFCGQITMRMSIFGSAIKAGTSGDGGRLIEGGRL
jgi:hypothetical protein